MSVFHPARVAGDAVARAVPPLPLTRPLLPPLGAALWAAAIVGSALLACWGLTHVSAVVTLLLLLALSGVGHLAPRWLLRLTRQRPTARAVVAGALPLHRASGPGRVLFFGAIAAAAIAALTGSGHPGAPILVGYVNGALALALGALGVGVLLTGALALAGRPTPWRRLWIPLALIGLLVTWFAALPFQSALGAASRGADPLAWGAVGAAAVIGLSLVGYWLYDHLHSKSSRALDVDPAGTRAVVARRGGATLYDLVEGGVLAHFSEGEHQVRFSPDGRCFAVEALDGELVLRRAADGALLRRLHGGPRHPRALAFDASGQHLAAIDEGGQATVWEVDAEPGQGGAALESLRLPFAYTSGVAFCDADQMVATTPAGRLGRARLGGAGTSTAAVDRAGAGVAHATLRGDGRAIAWAHGRAPLHDHVVLHAIQGSALHRVWSRQLPDAVRALRFSPGGELLAVNTLRSDLRLLDAETGAELAVREGHEMGVGAFAFHAGSEQLVIAGRWTVQAWHWPSDTVRVL